MSIMGARKMLPTRQPEMRRSRRNWKNAPPQRLRQGLCWSGRRAGWNRLPQAFPPLRLDHRTVTASRVRLAMPRGLNGTHRELSLAGVVALAIWRPPALQAREDPNTNGECGAVRHAR